MHQEKISLTWQTFSDHLKGMMKELMKNDDFADVTLVTEDRKHIKAHKNILSVHSPVFKDIMKLDQSAKTIIYLKSINFSEMQSIMQFLYLGEARLDEERVKEFLDVAKSLEIKELCNAEIETNDNVPSSSDSFTFSDNSGEHSVCSFQLMSQATKDEGRKDVVRVNGKYICDQCDYQATKRGHLKTHFESVHEGIKYAFNQCDYKATLQCNLKTHIESKHDGVKYACGQCDYQATTQRSLTRHNESRHENVRYFCDQCDKQFAYKCHLKTHIEAKHEGVKYDCDQCDYQAQATSQGSRKTHIEAKHNGVKYGCDQCDYQTTQKSHLKTHIKSKHVVTS